MKIEDIMSAPYHPESQERLRDLTDLYGQRYYSTLFLENMA